MSSYNSRTTNRKVPVQNEQNELITINGSHFEINKLPPEGRKLVALLKETQKELERLGIQKELFIASQQHLISLLKPYLSMKEEIGANTSVNVLGEASETIPTTPVTTPDQKPAPFPENLPESFKK